MAGEFKPGYRAARLVGGLMAGVGWAVLILGLIGIIIGTGIAGSIKPGPEKAIFAASAAFSFLVALIGLLLAGQGQLIRATADNANYNGEMLAIMRGSRHSA